MQMIMNVCQLKRMLYCPGSGHESLTTVGVSLVRYASRVFLVLKPPLSMTEAFSKPIVWLCDQAWFTILEPLLTILTFLEYSSFFLVLKALPIWVVFCKTFNNVNYGYCFVKLSRDIQQVAVRVCPVKPTMKQTYSQVHKMQFSHAYMILAIRPLFTALHSYGKDGMRAWWSFVHVCSPNRTYNHKQRNRLDKCFTRKSYISFKASTGTSEK